MVKNERLKQIQQFLLSENLDCSIEESTETIPYPQLLVFLGHDHQKREKLLTITTQEPLSLSQNTLKENHPTYATIQFIVKLPFVIKNNTVPDVASTLLFINRLVGLPGFELSEFDQCIYFRYVLLSTSEGLSQSLIHGLIGTILLQLDLFSETIEKVGDGVKTFNHLLEEILETRSS